MMSLSDILHWSDQHAAVLFVAIVFGAIVGAWLTWRSRGPWDAEAPVPMLRNRVSLAVAVMTSVVFAALAFAMKGEGRLLSFDDQVADAAQAHLGTTMLQMLAAITHLGDSHVLVIAGAIATTVLILLRRYLLASAFALSVVSNGLLIRIGKEYFQRARPLHEHGPVLETGYSFPSGHAAGSLMFYGMLAYVLMVLVPSRWHRPIVAAAILIVALVGCSRVLLQVHYLSDVCAGYALSFGWLALCVSAVEFLRSARLPRTFD